MRLRAGLRREPFLQRLEARLRRGEVPGEHVEIGEVDWLAFRPLVGRFAHPLLLQRGAHRVERLALGRERRREVLVPEPVARVATEPLVRRRFLVGAATLLLGDLGGVPERLGGGARLATRLLQRRARVVEAPKIGEHAALGGPRLREGGVDRDGRIHARERVGEVPAVVAHAAEHVRDLRVERPARVHRLEASLRLDGVARVALQVGLERVQQRRVPLVERRPAALGQHERRAHVALVGRLAATACTRGAAAPRPSSDRGRPRPRAPCARRASRRRGSSVGMRGMPRWPRARSTREAGRSVIAVADGAGAVDAADAGAGAGSRVRRADTSAIAAAAAIRTPATRTGRRSFGSAGGTGRLGRVAAPSVRCGGTGGSCGSSGGAGSVLLVAEAVTFCQPRRDVDAMPSSAVTMYSIASKRCDADFASAFMIVASTIDGSAGSSFDGGSGTLFRMASTSWKPSTPLGHGSTPVRSSYVTTPHANSSVRTSTVSPRICSGDRYHGVPTSPPSSDCVFRVVERRAARDVDLHALGDAEVEHLHDAVRAHHDVLGLHVAVHEAPLVGRPEGARSVHHPAELRVPGHRRVADVGSQALADDELHREEHLAVGLADVEHGDGVRVIERRRGARFAHDEGRRVGRRVRIAPPLGERGDRVDAQHLERDAPRKTRVVRAVHVGHASLAEELLDDVPVEAVACVEGHGSRMIALSE